MCSTERCCYLGLKWQHKFERERIQCKVISLLFIVIVLTVHVRRTSPVFGWSSHYFITNWLCTGYAMVSRLHIVTQRITTCMATEDTTPAIKTNRNVNVEQSATGIKKMLKMGAIFVFIGYLLLLFSLSQEFTTLHPVFAIDSMKMWLKLGGIGHILIGIFVALVGIIKALSLMPYRLR